MTEKEKVRLRLLMKNLDLTEEQALELLNSDKKVDKMKKMLEVQNDLTDSQKKVSKQARQVAKTTVGTKTQSERVKKTDNEKKELVAMIYNLLTSQEKSEQVEIVNDQKLITFVYNGRKFKLDLTASRK